MQALNTQKTKNIVNDQSLHTFKIQTFMVSRNTCSPLPHSGKFSRVLYLRIGTPRYFMGPVFMDACHHTSMCTHKHAYLAGLLFVVSQSTTIFGRSQCFRTSFNALHMSENIIAV